MEALNTALGDSTDFPDTGDIAADMTTQMIGVVRFFTHPELAPVLRAVIAGAQDDQALADKTMSDLIEPRRTGARQRLQLARERGELPPDCDPHQTMELLYAPLHYRPPTQSCQHRPLMGVCIFALSGVTASSVGRICRSGVG